MSRNAVLRKKEDFRRVYDFGKTDKSADVVLVFLRTTSQGERVAVVASRRVGKSVRRNRAKRLLREAHRRLRPHAALGGIDFVLIARPRAADRSEPQLEVQLRELYKKNGLIRSASAAPGGDTSDFTDQ